MAEPSIIPRERFLVHVFSAAKGKTIEELMAGIWVQAMPFSEFKHPLYGDVKIDAERATRFKQSFDSKTYKQDIPITFEHFGMDPSKGMKAAAWVKEVQNKDNGQFWKLAFTSEAAQEVADGAWRYISPEYYDLWEDPESGTLHTDVISGGALTNQPFFAGMLPLNFSAVLTESGAMNSAAEWEHSEPGTGPTPRLDETDPEAQGTRGNSGEPEEEDLGGAMPDVINELRQELGLGEDGDVLASVKALRAELAPLREAEQEADKAMAFSKQFPTEFAEMQRLKESDAAREAQAFSKKYAKARLIKSEKGEDGEDVTEETPFGFSSVTVEKIEEAHKAMSAGTFKEEHMSAVLDSLMNTGLVDHSERGSSRDVPETPKGKEAPNAFSALVSTIMQKDNLDVTAATRMAASKDPELYRAYREAVAPS